MFLIISEIYLFLFRTHVRLKTFQNKSKYKSILIKAKKLKTKKRPIFVNETGRLSLLIKENVFSIITVPNHWEQEFLLQRHLFAEQRNLKVHSAD